MLFTDIIFAQQVLKRIKEMTGAIDLQAITLDFEAGR